VDGDRRRGLLFATLIQESYGVTQGSLTMLTIWAHLVASSQWTGGLLALPMLFLKPLRALESGERADLRRRTARLFFGLADRGCDHLRHEPLERPA